MLTIKRYVDNGRTKLAPLTKTKEETQIMVNTIKKNGYKEMSIGTYHFRDVIVKIVDEDENAVNFEI